MIRYIFGLVGMVLASSFSMAQFEAGGMGGVVADASDDGSKFEAFTDVKTVVPGQSFTVAFQMEHPRGWHSYYKNSGGMEMTPEFEWQLADGVVAGEVQWPVPEVKDSYFEMPSGGYFKSHVYGGSPVFLVDFQVPAGVPVGKTLTIRGNAKWQICKDSCRDESKAFSVAVVTGKELVKDESMAKKMEQARAEMPVDSKKLGWTFRSKVVGDKVEVRIAPGKAGAKMPKEFVPDQAAVLAMSAGGSIRQDGDEWVMTLATCKESAVGEKLALGKGVSGILVSDPSVILPMTEFATAAGGGQTKEGVQAAPMASESLSLIKYLPVLGGMFLGGLILNLMPCVFPVIGIKIMGFVQQAGSDRKKIMMHGLVFTAGVMASFAVLSTILFFLRESIGWGFQLQNPWVVMVLLVLMLVMALNMYGVFEMGVAATSVGGELQGKSGLAGTFFSGVLATVVATPCSGPFLGAAIGAAYILPAVQFFTAFAAMAMGLSLPYLILSVFPKLIGLLPRPGAWMESFKQGMSFLLFATVGYLMWVYAGLVELENMMYPVFGVTTIAFAGWIYGRWSLPYRRMAVRIRAWVLTVVLGLAGVWLLKPVAPSHLVWEPWTQAKMEEVLKSGKPVYVDFTAKWCATCQLNKKRAYNDEVVALMAKKGVVAFRADKTKESPEIDAAIKKLGRSAIPVNVLVSPDGQQVIFPELLSSGDLLKELKRLK